MLARFSLIASLAALSSLAACAPAGSSAYNTDQPPQLTAKQQAKLDRLLKGRVAGEPVSCISQTQIRDFTAVSDDVLVYDTGGTVYVNRPYGGCPGVTRDTLITRTPSTQLCSGDIATVQDLQIPMSNGSCAFGDFVPYRKVSSKGG